MLVRCNYRFQTFSHILPNTGILKRFSEYAYTVKGEHDGVSAVMVYSSFCSLNIHLITPFLLTEQKIWMDFLGYFSNTSSSNNPGFVRYEGHACRAGSDSSYLDHGIAGKDFHLSWTTFDNCRDICLHSTACTGFEHHRRNSRCEIWTSNISHTQELGGYDCYILLEKAAHHSWLPTSDVSCPSNCGLEEHYLQVLSHGIRVVASNRTNFAL